MYMYIHSTYIYIYIYNECTLSSIVPYGTNFFFSKSQFDLKLNKSRVYHEYSHYSLFAESPKMSSARKLKIKKLDRLHIGNKKQFRYPEMRSISNIFWRNVCILFPPRYIFMTNKQVLPS